MSKINISTAKRTKKNKFPIPTRTITTLDFGRLCATNVIEVTPGDVIKTNYYQETQLASLVSNTYGSAFIKTFATFVPYRVVWNTFEQYMTNSKDSTLELECPRFSYYTLYRILFGLKFQEVFEVTQKIYEEFGAWVPDFYSTEYASFEYKRAAVDSLETDAFKHAQDFVFVQNHEIDTGSINYYSCKLNTKGRWLVHLFESLGYKLPRVVFVAGNNNDSFYSQYRSALPLLCYVRFMYDYVFPSQYVQEQGFAYLFENIGAIDSDALEDIFKLLFVPYSEDFFTSLWSYPNAVSVSTADQNYRRMSAEQSGLRLQLLSNGYGNQLQQEDSTKLMTLTSFGLRLLESISDFSLRNQIGGTRFHEWMKAHFGFVTAPQDSTRSVFLKSFSDEVNFSPIYAQTAVQGYQNLGAKAGIGNSKGAGKLTFEAKEHGLLLFVTMVIPSTGYVQGEKPWVKNVDSPFDFYTPELDSVGTEPIPRSRLYMDYDSFGRLKYGAPIGNINGVFGFAPRYADRFKHGQDFLHGDFTLGSRNVNMQSYHTFRDVMFGRTNLALDAQFLQADNQFDRIFASDPTTENGDSYDKFISLFVYNTTRYSNMLSIGESMPIFNKQGDDVTLDNTGTSVIG